MSDAMTLSTATPPQPPGADDRARVEEQGRRRSILEGIWRRLLELHALQQLKEKRAAMVGIVDTSSNLALQFVVQISHLHSPAPPKVIHTDKAGLDTMQTHLESSRCWGLANRNQRFTLLLREGVMITGWHGGKEKDGGRLVVRQVSADFTWGTPHPNDPTQFGTFWEARERDVIVDEKGTTKRRWTWDVWDVRDPDPDAPEGSLDAQRPWFRIFDAERKDHDLTAQFVEPEEWTGAAFPYRDVNDQPVIPAVLYHASPHDGLWAWTEGSEIVFGTLQDGLNWTMVNHGFKVGSFRVRYIAGGKIKGGVVKEITATAGGEKVETHTVDPGVALEIASDGGDTVTVGEWGESVDISKAEQFARNYGRRLAVHFGLSPADVSFEARAPQSGISLTVSRQGQRKLQATQAPQFKEGDLLLLERISAVLRAHDVKVPADGFGIEYAAIELSPAERKEVLENLREELEMGLISKLDAWMMLHPGATEAEGKRALKAIDKEIEAEREAAPTPAATPPQPAGDGEGGPEGDSPQAEPSAPAGPNAGGSSASSGDDPPA